MTGAPGILTYFFPMHPNPRLFIFAVACAALSSAAQTATPFTPAASTPTQAAAAPAATPPASTAAATPPAADKPSAPWPRPADGPPIFTEDFESGEINPKIWLVRSSGPATATIVQDKVAHGKNALKIHYPANTNRAYAFIGTLLPAAVKDHLYGRVYVYVSSLPQPHSVLLLAGSSGFPAANWLEIGTYHDAFQPSVQRQAATTNRGEKVAFEGPIPFNRWFCLEWEFLDQPDRIVEWVDGKLAVNQAFNMNGTESGLIGGFAELDLGFRTFAQAATITQDLDIYYDDLAVGDKPIGPLAPGAAPASAATSAAK